MGTTDSNKCKLKITENIDIAKLFNTHEILQVRENGIYCTIRVDGSCFSTGTPEDVLARPEVVPETPEVPVQTPAFQNQTAGPTAQQVAEVEDSDGVRC